MSDVNRIFLTGRLVADPDIRYTPTGNEVAQFRIAVNMRYRSKQDPTNWQEETSFITIIAWNKLADKVEKTFKKGDLIFVEGRLRIREYEVEGNKRYATEVVARDIKLIVAKGAKEIEIEEATDESEPDVPFA
ncbi:single-stranded DNA-binding protein [Caldisericum exile]|uniref:Single-stranded DNA-binding protein n=1 Tax=Caldisericum exile (strain DSM 21853 / NBRC 104410 / AZM16c01) TaxID=511051 RepID=A0A7U6GDL1_CALEA|nr:single-stranded DNA-binding protein [Caldisericum exile]BAL80462.1 single-stranded DNA-binding protein [Caldisericum exile AZM16c01]